MITVDIACDLMDEDETGYVWAFLGDARDPALVEPGAIVAAATRRHRRSPRSSTFVEKPAGPVVHLRVLPGTIEDYLALVRRAITPG